MTQLFRGDAARASLVISACAWLSVAAYGCGKTHGLEAACGADGFSFGDVCVASKPPAAGSAAANGVGGSGTSASGANVDPQWGVAVTPSNAGKGSTITLDAGASTTPALCNPDNVIDKVDMLFMVDNSNSMADKQVSLGNQFPKLVSVLTSGMRSANDEHPFTPIKDLHVGVVSSDMGIPGVENDFGCDPNGGDDGRLQHMPRGDMPGCVATYPSFLTFTQGMDATQFASDVRCIALLGMGGCGFEQQLEAPLKALWPSVYLDSRGSVVTPNPITFLSTTAAGTLGHGDQPAAVGGNAGFLRSDRLAGLSLLVIVVLTDEDDCSPRTTDFLEPPNQLDSSSPYKSEDINLRCHYNQDKLYDVARRYYEGFSMLRPSNPELVMFAAIAGVPTDMVDADARSAVDFSDATQRDAYYDRILDDPRMQETVDPATNPGSGTGNLLPSCNGITGSGHMAIAYPARRITTLAKMFQGNGVLQSICQGDLSAPLDAIIDAIAARAGTKISCQ